VYELLPGVDSRAAWQEARLLRNCTHPRIVPLLGIAIRVGAHPAAAPLLQRAVRVHMHACCLAAPCPPHLCPPHTR
jgi:hypothetical protein